MTPIATQKPCLSQPFSSEKPTNLLLLMQRGSMLKTHSQIPYRLLTLTMCLIGDPPIQRILWPRKTSADHICQLYMDYVTQRYSKATIVFDGYPAGPSTKDVTHLRRTKGCCGSEVHFSGQTVFVKPSKQTEVPNNFE